MTLTPEQLQQYEEADVRGDRLPLGPLLRETRALRARVAELEEAGAGDYERGEASGYADWVGALADFCENLTPKDGWTPTSTVRVIKQLEAQAGLVPEVRAGVRLDAEPGGAYAPIPRGMPCE